MRLAFLVSTRVRGWVKDSITLDDLIHLLTQVVLTSTSRNETPSRHLNHRTQTRGLAALCLHSDEVH